MDLSPDCVYLRKNIHQITETTEQGEVTLWEYDEAILTREEYEQYCASINDPGIQKLADDNLVLMNAHADTYTSSEENNLVIMAAIAELYELVSGGKV